MNLLKFSDFIFEGFEPKVETEEEMLKRRESKWLKRLKYIKKLEPKTLSKSDLDSYNIPDKIKEMMMEWDIIRRSPYSDSFYNSHDISWTHKPDGSYRVSDHWNFYTKDHKKHCKTDIKTPNTTHVSIGKYNSEKGIYEIILTEPKKSHTENLNRKERKLKYLQNPEVIYKKKLFKDRYSKGEILVDFNYDGIQYNGILKGWTGFKIKIENELGEVIFSNMGQDDIKYNKIDSLEFTDKNGSEISDPYQDDPR